MCQTLGSISLLQRQDLYLGQDSEKHTYYFFPQFNTTDIRVFKKNHKVKSYRTIDSHEYELIAWDLDSLQALITQFQRIKKSKNSNLHDLQQTVEALYDELSKREDSFKKAHEKGKMSLMKDYYEYLEKEEGLLFSFHHKSFHSCNINISNLNNLLHYSLFVSALEAEVEIADKDLNDQGMEIEEGEKEEEEIEETEEGMVNDELINDEPKEPMITEAMNGNKSSYHFDLPNGDVPCTDNQSCEQKTSIFTNGMQDNNSVIGQSKEDQNSETLTEGNDFQASSVENPEKALEECEVCVLPR